MKRFFRTTPGRMLFALHAAALLAGCAAFDNPPPRYGSLKDDPIAVAEVAQEAPRRVLRVAQHPGDWTAKPASKVEARPIKASAGDDAVPAPAKSAAPPVKVAQDTPPRAAEGKAASRPGFGQAPLRAPSQPPPPAGASTVPRAPTSSATPAAESSRTVQSSAAATTTTTVEVADARIIARPGSIDRPDAIERPGSADRDGGVSRSERPSAEARRATPSSESMPPPASEPKARLVPPAQLPEPKAAMVPQPPAAKPAPAPSATPPASLASPAAPAPASAAAPPPASPSPAPPAKAQPAPKAASQQPAANKQGKEPQVPLGPADQPGAPGGIAAMIERSELLLRIGNVSDARDVLTPGVNSSSPDAITALAKTYDPNELKAFLVPPGTSDVAKATQLYTEAARLGSLDARRRLERLRSTPAETPPAPAQPATKK